MKASIFCSHSIKYRNYSFYVVCRYNEYHQARIKHGVIQLTTRCSCSPSTKNKRREKINNSHTYNYFGITHHFNTLKRNNHRQQNEKKNRKKLQFRKKKHRENCFWQLATTAINYCYPARIKAFILWSSPKEERAKKTKQNTHTNTMVEPIARPQKDASPHPHTHVLVTARREKQNTEKVDHKIHPLESRGGTSVCVEKDSSCARTSKG